MTLSVEQHDRIKKRRQMQLRFLRLARECVRLNLRHLRPGENTTADNYLKVLNEQYALTDRITDVILDMHGTDVERIVNVLHDLGDSIAAGDQLRGRGRC